MDAEKRHTPSGTIELGDVSPSPATSSVSSSHTIDSRPIFRNDGNRNLHRELKPRHIAMISIGGAIGTGLLIGTGAALAKSGPASIFIAYSVVACIVYLVMCALGEMATWIPMQSGFTGYAGRFCDPCLGFALGYTYWFKYLVVCPSQLTAAALVIQYWIPREKVNPGVWIALFLVVTLTINYLGVDWFGELEFWLSSIKVLTLTGLVLLCVVLVLGGGPDHDRKGFRYWKNPGAFRELYGTGDTGRFFAVWSAFVTATFAFLGCEIVGVTIGEAQNPRKVIPKAIKLTLWRMVGFYVLLVFLVGLLVPYNSQQLAFANKATTSAAASPFVTAIIESGIPVLPGFLNGCILLFVFSAANSDLYISSRTLYGLAKEGNAPAMFAKTNERGIPVNSLAVSGLLACLAFMNVSDDSKTIFGYFSNLTTIFGILTWISILVAHIYFVRAREAQGIYKRDMVYTAPLGVYGTWVALGMCIVITIFKNFDVFVHDSTRKHSPNFDYTTFITAYLGIPLYLGLIFGYKFVRRSRAADPRDVDLHTGKAEIDKMEEEFLAKQRAVSETKKKANRLYDHFVGWLL